MNTGLQFKALKLFYSRNMKSNDKLIQKYSFGCSTFND